MSLTSRHMKKKTFPSVSRKVDGRIASDDNGGQASSLNKIVYTEKIKNVQTPGSTKSSSKNSRNQTPLKNTPKRATGQIYLKANKSNLNTVTPSSNDLKKNSVLETPKKTKDLSNPLLVEDINRRNDSVVVNDTAVENCSYNILQENASFLLHNNSDIPTLPVNYDNSSITVAVRVRPFSARELDTNQENVVIMSGNVTTLRNLNGYDHEFAYDFSFWSFDLSNQIAPFISQTDVYNCVAKPLMDWAFDGYNTCLFAYGQTGSGKSYTIMGYEDEEAGIIPRFSKDLFIKTSYFEEQDNTCYSVEISFYEIYNEKIFDLLSFNEGNKQKLSVREHPDFGPYVQGLSKHIVAAHTDILEWLEVGNKNRATAATGMNDKSSRSHSVFTVVLKQVKTEVFEENETKVQKISRINLIDLTGSERASKVLDHYHGYDSPTANARLKEGSCINKSLHTLGKVISILADCQINSKQKETYIPYRDSILTWLLKDSLGGNSRTTMLATVSPAAVHYSDTLSTLRYAQQARSIVNKAKINEDPKSKLIREMLGEIKRLKDSQCQNGNFGHFMEKEVLILREKLEEARTALTASTKSWQEQLAASEKKQKEAARHLRKSGVSFTKLEHRLPSLVNLNEDPQLAEVLLYVLQEGLTNVGSKEPGGAGDIQLRGNLISELHCVFECNNEEVTITAVDDAQTYVNGALVVDKVLLHHGDRIVFGGDHFFRLNHPKEAFALKEEYQARQKGFIDFEYAKDELMTKQNNRLEAELEEARLKAEEDALLQIKEAQSKAERDMKVQRESFEQQLSILKNKLENTANKKKEAEEDHESAQEIISQLRARQKLLEDEIVANRNRLHVETLTAKQVLEETKANHRRVLHDLEEERRQVEFEVEMMKNSKPTRDRMRASITIPVNQHGRGDDKHRDLLKIALMLREANQINQKARQPFLFTREDTCYDGKVVIRIRVFDKEHKKTAVLNIDQFEEELTSMKDKSDYESSFVPLVNHERYQWQDHNHTIEEISGLTSPRMSISNVTFSMVGHYKEQTFDHFQCHRDTSMNATSVGDLSKMSNVSTAPVESTRLSSVHSEAVVAIDSIDFTKLRSSMFETIVDDHIHDVDISVVSRLLKLICSIYTTWQQVDVLTTVNQTTLQSNTSFADDPLVMLACNLKALKDIASLLCSVHEAIGLNELRTMTNTFKGDVEKACSFIRNNVASNKCEKKEQTMKLLIYQLVEITGAMSLAAVDYIDPENKSLYFHPDDNKGTKRDLLLHFLKHQNRFLTTMVSEALSTIQNGITNVKNLQLSCTHEMSEDLVDGVMNILTSATTLLQNCKSLLGVYADISVSDVSFYYAKECYLMRQLLTTIVDYNENVYNLLEHSKNVAENCDSLVEFLDVPIELADTTKRICAAGKELVQFVASNKELDNEIKTILLDYFEKFEFAGKTVRVGVAIVLQEAERDLDVKEEQSIVSLIQNDEPFTREVHACPLNRTSLDITSLTPELRSKFKKGRKSSVNPDLFISKYMDTTDM